MLTEAILSSIKDKAIEDKSKSFDDILEEVSAGGIQSRTICKLIKENEKYMSAYLAQRKEMLND